MATIGTKVTLTDIQRRLDPNDKIAKLIEIMTDMNPILDDMVVVEGNLPVGHRTTTRTGLPTPTWRKLNYGVQPTKSTTAQVTDSCGMLEAYAEVDKALADLNGNTSAFRLSEDYAHLEGMNQAMASTLFYGDTTVDPEKFVGLAPRFDTPSTNVRQSGYNMINGGGTGDDNTSIWLVVWGENTCHGIFPKASKAGFTMEDKGQVTLEDANGGRYEGYRTHYKWDLGMTVRDWRYVVRIPNIDMSNLITETGAADLTKLMIRAIHRVPNLNMGRPVFYANRDVIAMLDIQTLHRSNAALTYKEIQGKAVLDFRGIPIRRTDGILSTEAAISF